MENEILSRTRMLFGDNGVAALQQKRVIIFGIGGVGSWCAESLIRTGIQHLTLVDADTISISNINRQLHATIETVGQIKVEAMRNRLLLINPQADIQTIYDVYDEQTHEKYNLDSYDYIVDAIDSLQAKAFLIEQASNLQSVFVSSMGAALKVDPTRVRVADFWDVQGCPLGSKLRKLLRKRGNNVGNFKCVFSDEVLPNVNSTKEEQPQILNTNNGTWSTKKVATNGSIVHITAIFGFMLAGLIVEDIYSKIK